MKYYFFSMLWMYLFVGCQSNQTSVGSSADTTKQIGQSKKFIQINRKVNDNTPTVEITNYNLITNNFQRDSAEAEAIIKAKVILPLAMQKHDASLFDSALTEDFTSRSEDEFFDRAEYIQNRVNGKWIISDVQYENLVLEFFGDIAVLTYRNTVKEKDETGKPQTWHYTWTDIWVKEEGRWKVKALRGL
jgi:ketosteroid isomerase-like protein